MAKKDSHFEEPERKSLFEREGEVLEFWKKNKIFEKSLEKNPKKNIFSFYDGPPFITGLPHYATLLPSIAKDIIPRYQTMKGKYVPRVWGWDVHGLPVENKIEEKLNLKNKKDIEEFGVDKFIKEARDYVNVNTEEWKWYIDRIGRWADMDNPYRTDDQSYVESVMWVFKELYDKDLIYKGQRVQLYCTRCGSVVSKFEITMDAENYKDVEDPAVTIAFKIKDEDVHVLAWTTTPWTLPANNGLAVNPDITYVKITDGEKHYVLAKEALERYEEFKDWEIEDEKKGKILVGKSFEPLFEPNFTPDPKKDHKIHSADFPTTEEGTGIVHIAPGFGEDDFVLGQKEGLTVPNVLEDDGTFKKEVQWPWAGVYFKKADPEITEALHKNGALVKKESITHSYPHCYRCGTPLIYMAQSSWLVKIDKIRKDLLKTNKDINWIPSHFGEKRFTYNIENAPDWSISRARYWGVPIPIWETEDGQIIVPGSIEEIEKLSGDTVTDLHRPKIDEIIIKTKDGKEARRIPDVLDVWFESGSMPYAQDHYPFENKDKFESGFPTDFITEYTGQLRGWFYSLHVLSNVLKNKPAFKNVVVTGVLAGTDGRKMSKSLGNYPDPKATIEKYGAESLRLYFMGSKIMNGEDLSLNETDIKEQHGILNILWNSYKYFTTYANVHNFNPKGDTPSSKNILDNWIKTRLEEFIKEYSEGLDSFDFPTSTRAIRPFIEDLSTWYIRRSRDRFAEGDKDALETLHYILVRFSKAVAPTLPFTADAIYKNLSNDKMESVHLEDYPEADEKLIKKNGDLLDEMQLTRDIASNVLALRADANQPIRQKLATLSLGGVKLDENLVNILKDEVNVNEIVFDSKDVGSFAKTEIGKIEICLDTVLTDELKKDGVYREVTRALQNARKEAGLDVGQKADLIYSSEDELVSVVIKENIEEIKELAHFSEIKIGAGETKILGGRLSITIKG